jgi:hypothetical protein
MVDPDTYYINPDPVPWFCVWLQIWNRKDYQFDYYRYEIKNTVFSLKSTYDLKCHEKEFEVIFIEKEY